MNISSDIVTEEEEGEHGIRIEDTLHNHQYFRDPSSTPSPTLGNVIPHTQSLKRCRASLHPPRDTE